MMSPRIPFLPLTVLASAVALAGWDLAHSDKATRLTGVALLVAYVASAALLRRSGSWIVMLGGAILGAGAAVYFPLTLRTLWIRGLADAGAMKMVALALSLVSSFVYAVQHDRARAAGHSIELE